MHDGSTGAALTAGAALQEESAEVQFPTVKDFLQYMGHRQMLGIHDHEPEQLQPDEEYDDNNYDEDWLDWLRPSAGVLGVRRLPAFFLWQWTQ